MKRQLAIFLCSTVLGFVTLSSHAMAQQKTVRECREEWRANKTANQANGVIERAYVAQCRAGGAPTQTTVAPAPPTSTAQKTVRECQEEWRANKAANQAAGVTERAYVAQCRAGGAPAQTTAAPAPAPTVPDPTPTATPTVPAAPVPTTASPATTAPAPTAAAPTEAAPPIRPIRPIRPVRPLPEPTSTNPVPSNQTAPVPANQFSTEAEAKARCPSDTIVWVNLRSKIYHFSGSRSYGTTEMGAYMCERDTAAEGMRAAKNETHP